MGAFAMLYKEGRDPLLRQLCQLVMTDEAFPSQVRQDSGRARTIPSLSTAEHELIEDWAAQVFQVLLFNLSSPMQKGWIYSAVGLDAQWCQAAFMEAITDTFIRNELSKSSNVFRVLVKTLINAGIITDRTPRGLCRLSRHGRTVCRGRAHGGRRDRRGRHQVPAHPERRQAAGDAGDGSPPNSRVLRNSSVRRDRHGGMAIPPLCPPGPPCDPPARQQGGHHELFGRLFLRSGEAGGQRRSRSHGLLPLRLLPSWSAGPVNAFSLWKPGTVKVTQGTEHVATYAKTPASERQYCTRCGGASDDQPSRSGPGGCIRRDHPGPGVQAGGCMSIMPNGCWA